MAIAFARTSIHSRAKGHSAVAAAAYRAGVELEDERLGKTFSYKNRHDVLYSSILLPDGASDKLLNRSFLWNEVERAEKRKDAQLCKDVILALPKEASLELQITLTRKFVFEHYVSKGIAADINIHDDNNGNPHAHVLLTTRRIEGERFSKHKARDLNPSFINKAGKKGYVKEADFIGESWRYAQNEFFVEHNIDLEVDPTSYQAKEREPKINHTTGTVSENNKLIDEARIEIALNDPTLLLSHLTLQNSVFNEWQLNRLLEKNIPDETLRIETLKTLQAHPDFIHLGPGDDGRERFTSRQTIEEECRLMESAKRLNQQTGTKQNPKKLLWIVEKLTLNEGQKDALTYLAGEKRLCSVIGVAGAGKSHLLSAARLAWEEQGLHIQGLAVSGIAAKGLEKDAGIPSKTSHQIIKRIENNSWDIDKNSIVVMDEAGMTPLSQMLEIIRYVELKGAKLVLVGDDKQLQPIDKGAPFRAIIEATQNFKVLDEVVRQKDEKDRQATKDFAFGKTTDALNHYDQKGAISLFESDEKAYEQLIDKWHIALNETAINHQIILAHKRDDVTALNIKARECLIQDGVLKDESILLTAIKDPIEVRVGERLLFTKNDPNICVKNGEFATVTGIKDDYITFISDGEKAENTIRVDQLKDVSYGYATTVHKSQGITRENVFVYASGKLWDQFLTYVACSRHKKQLAIFGSQDSFKDKAALIKALSKKGIKDNVIDYAYAFSMRRNFEQEGILKRAIYKIFGKNHKVHNKDTLLGTYYEQLSAKEKLAHLEKKAQRLHATRVAAFIDEYRALGKAWGQMNEKRASIANYPIKLQQFYQSEEYKALKARAYLNQKEADLIVRDYETYKAGLIANGFDVEKLIKIRKSYQKTKLVKDFIKAYQQKCFTFSRQKAHIISNDIKSLYPILIEECANQQLSVNEVIREAKQQALRYTFENAKSNAKNKDEVKAITLVYSYLATEAKLKQRLKLCHRYFNGFENMDKAHLMMMNNERHTLNGIADKIINNSIAPSVAKNVFSLDEKDFFAQSDAYNRREMVKDYAKKQKSISKEQLAREILNDKTTFRYVYELEIDWKELSKDKKDFNFKERLASLDKKERDALILVNHYQNARIEAAKAWGKYFEEKDNIEETLCNNPAFSNENQQKREQKLSTQKEIAKHNIAKRNELAYQVMTKAEITAPFLQELKIKKGEFEKQVSAYIKDNTQVKKTKRQKESLINQSIQAHNQPVFDKKSQQFDAKIVNLALTEMGEAFFSRVFGFDGKKENKNSIRFGQGNAIGACVTGQKAGSWHSFASGEGGGPIHLLMSKNHGLGLSFKDAVKEGAAIAGLSPNESLLYQSPIIHQKAKKEEQLHQEALKKIEKKIEQARYYYDSGQPIANTLAEKYLREHRQITAELYELKFHPRVRDSKLDKKTGKYTISYHPALVAASKNEKGEITATHTILLDKNTANKVNEKTVGVVKRSRGVVKDSAVCVKESNSNKVIIAEGIETALSIASTGINANIYVTLGNIKNAESLSWLAKKHQSKEILFAADFDPQTNHANVKVIKEIAKTFKDEHQLETYIAHGYLNEGEKSDHNDILKAKGKDGVKESLKFKKILIKEVEKIIGKETLSKNLNSLNKPNELNELNEKDKPIAKERPIEDIVEKAVKDYIDALHEINHGESYIKAKKALKAQVSKIIKTPGLLKKIQENHPKAALAIHKRAKSLGLYDKERGLDH